MKCVECDKIMKVDNVHHCHHGTFCSKKCKNKWHRESAKQIKDEINEKVDAI